MSIPPIQGLSTSLPSLNDVGGATRAQETSTNFKELISNGIQDVNQQLTGASKMSQEFLTQGKHDLHEVMIALDQADLSFRYMVQIRNKVLDAYNDVMRMQV